MKRFFFFLFSLLFACHAHATTPVRLEVHVDSENKSAGGKAVEKTHAHWLTVRVSSTSSGAVEGLTLRWMLYAADLQRGSDQVRVERSGDVHFGIGVSLHFVDLTTPKVPFTWIPQHAERTGSGRRAYYKTIPETGHRYHGYRVQVLSGDTVVAEAISNEALRNIK